MILTKKQLKRLHKYVMSLFSFKTEVTNVWFSIMQCMQRGGGDCDDYRNAMYEHLSLLGVPDSRIVFLDVLLQKGRFAGDQHAILLIDEEYIMCNIYGVLLARDYYRKTEHYIQLRYTMKDLDLGPVVHELDHSANERDRYLRRRGQEVNGMATDEWRRVDSLIN